jgi:hypothetical protein
MRLTLVLACGAVAALTSAAGAVNIYMISGGDPITDSAAVTALTSRGHTVTVGVDCVGFDGSVSLTGFDTVYLQNNYNWTTGLMPVAGQQQLIDWVTAGGRLVTSEWVIYYTYAGGRFGTLGSIIPAEQTYNYAGMTSTTYDAVTAHPGINAGLPPSFGFPLTSYTGTETLILPKTGAAVFYSTATSTVTIPAHSRAGLLGWAVGHGTVLSFGSTCGPDQVGDANFGLLFSNVMGATVASGGCYPNCDASTTAPILNVQDFTCFLQQYAAGASYANCDGSTVAPVLNVQDFTCFLQRYAAGCP